ncbi:hypothetical protein Ana3638_18845 [Anaerocolumna sedimenticola]|uniref:Uncharacterized protein n=1 Tax=Anaerocolumna sedimenticola TaxID=2696063 RepID=A0A6P1TQ34_9FIRM|nr:hypothetical protein [Anaerocolumna sedimenticola]QHQ62583.1 hypothetical protein Ana3638_18845 [Anaerocolumna sedimenticola]
MGRIWHTHDHPRSSGCGAGRQVYLLRYPEEANSLAPGMEVRIGDSAGSIISIVSTPIEITADFNAYALYLSGLQAGDWVVPVTVDVSAQDGVYIAQIVLETISPISFVLN